MLYRKQRDCTIRVAKTKTLISFAVTAKLICVFVFAYAKSRFSHNEAQIIVDGNPCKGYNERWFKWSTFPISKLFFFCFVVVIFDLVHDVETIFHLHLRIKSLFFYLHDVMKTVGGVKIP